MAGRKKSERRTARPKDAPVIDGFDRQVTVVTFPSWVMHRVTPVTKGVRYSLIAWIVGPRWR
jgi:PKHD-type hydroxylase